MTPNEMQTALSVAVEEVLETMCFSGVLASDEGNTSAPSEDPATPPVAAELQFDGQPPGAFRVSLPAHLARALGAAFLGRDEDEVSDADAADVVCELANMVCGSVLSRLESQATFRIGHPELAAPAPGPAFDESAASRWFDLGEGCLTTALQFQPPTARA